MASRRTDFLIREQLNRAMKRLNRIIDRYQRLDDFAWILRNQQQEINRVLRNYKGDLGFLTNFFTDEKIDILGAEAVKTFQDSLKAVPQFESLVVGRQRVNQLVNSIKREYGKTTKGVINSLFDNQATKTRRFKIMAQAEKVTTERVAELLGRRGIVKIGGDEFDNKSIGELWDVLTNRYGNHEDVIFTSGHKMPLNTYVNGKAITMTQDINNTVVATESARRGIQVNKISSHGASDSCNIHEGTFVFITETAKQQFLSQHPEIKVARSFKTFAQVKGDRTHIFVFGCRHRLTPAPLQFMSEGAIKKIDPSPSLATTSKEARVMAKEVNEARAS